MRISHKKEKKNHYDRQHFVVCSRFKIKQKQYWNIGPKHSTVEYFEPDQNLKSYSDFGNGHNTQGMDLVGDVKAGVANDSTLENVAVIGDSVMWLVANVGN